MPFGRDKAPAAVRAQLRGINDDLDACFAARFKQAQKDGEIGKAVDADMRGRLATGLLHTLSLRARSGEKRAALEALTEAWVKLPCG